MPVSKETTIQIPEPNIQIMNVTINGLTPIIFHRWSEKAKLMLLKTQQKDPSAKIRQIRNPQEEYMTSFYRDSEGFISLPVLNIKQAIVDSARNIPGVAMTILKGAVFTVGDVNGMVKILVNGQPVRVDKEPNMVAPEEQTSEIIGTDPDNSNIEMRQDLVRVGMGSADLRYRGSIKNWSITFQIKWNADLLSAGQVLNLLNISGFSCGLGEWRPQSSGISGTYEVSQS